MNITIINKHRADTLGGSELQCDFIASELTQRGHDVSYVAPTGKQTKNYNRDYRVLPCEHDADDIIDNILKSNPDIVYWRFNKNYLLSVMLRLKKAQIPVIFAASHINDLNPWTYKKRSGIRGTIKGVFNNHWNHLGLRFASAITVNNEEFLDELSIDHKYFIPNGMPLGFESFQWEKRYCAWVSNIKQVKRPEKFIELAKEFSDKEIDFLMVGNVQEGRYNWIKDSKNLPDNLHYLGAKTPEQVNGILKSAELHIHTCYPEGFPNVFIQAWLQETPSVSLGFNPNNYLKTYKMGYDAGENWEEFTSYVSNLLTDKTLRDQFGSNAFEFANKTFRIEKAVDKLEEIFQEFGKK